MPRTKSPSLISKPTESAIENELETISRLAEDPQLISGIYNYCDRWCERCPMTAHCLTFKIEQSHADQPDGATHDLHDPAFWHQIALNFAVTGRMLEREAKKHGLNLDEIANETGDLVNEKRRQRRTASFGHPLHRAASAYRKTAKGLLDRLTPELVATEEALNTQLRLGAGEPEAVAIDVDDALEVVHWYLFFIEVKLRRAASSRVEEQEDGDDGFPSDADGSAKIALIAIERSIGAWVRLRQHLAGFADEILTLLVQLEKLRRAVERKFPGALTFKRPGFDA